MKRKLRQKVHDRCYYQLSIWNKKKTNHFNDKVITFIKMKKEYVQYKVSNNEAKILVKYNKVSISECPTLFKVY